MKEAIDLKKYSSFVDTCSLVKKTGKLNRIIGLLIEADGPGVAIGSICTIKSQIRPPVKAQVVGFRDNRTLLMPLGDIFGWSVLRLNRKRSEKQDQRRVKTEAGTDALPQPHVLPEPATKQVVHA